MESLKRLHPRPDAAQGPAAWLALAELRKRAWETLLDLGLSDEEIAAYYGNNLHDSGHLPLLGNGDEAR